MDDHDKSPQPGRGTAPRPGPAIPFLCAGIAFMAAGVGNPSLMAVGLPMLTLGIVFLARSRKHQRSQKGG